MNSIGKLLTFLCFLTLSDCKQPSEEATADETKKAELQNVAVGLRNSTEFGEVELILLNNPNSSDICCQVQIKRQQQIVKTLPLIPGDEAFHINFFHPDQFEYKSSLELVDLNRDGLDDAIVHSVFLPGAGPQAGMEIDMYACFLQKKGKLVIADYLHDVPCSESETYVKNRDYYLKYKHLPVGIEIAESDRETYDLKPGERLIFSTTIEGNGKFVTVAVQEHLKYLVYRFGNEKSVELEVIERKDEKNRRFLYFHQANYGFTRYEYHHLIFGNETYRYTVFNNSDEHQRLDGNGVIVESLKDKKTVIMKAEGGRGSLELLQDIPWLKKEEVTGDDYADEQ